MSALTPIALLARVAASPLGARLIVTARLHELARLARATDTDPAALLASTLLLGRRARFLFDRSRVDEALGLLERGAALLDEHPVPLAGDASAGGATPLSHGLAGMLRLEALDFSLTLGRVDEWTDGAMESLRGALGVADSLWERLSSQNGPLACIGEGAAHDALLALLDQALRALFHARLHFGARPSPYSGGPAAVDRFLAPLRESIAWQALTGLSSGKTHVSVAPGVGRARRVLFVSVKNWNFLTGILEDYDADPDVEVRRLDLAGGPEPVPTRASILRHRLALALGDPTPATSERIAGLLSWADVVLVEWGQLSATWASLVVPEVNPRARLVVRLHSFEAFTPYPLLTDWNGVDALITVSPAIRALVAAAVPLPQSLELHDVRNRFSASDFRLPKTADAARTIALVGWGKSVKDPEWALDVLDLLRAGDPRWRLLLIGPDFADGAPLEDVPEAERETAARVRSRIRALGESIEITGETTAVAEHLRRAGVIVSASRRESNHMGLVEGAASGALPVCRDWPEVAAWGGARGLYPPEWIVSTPDEAAARILSSAPDEGGAAADWVRDHLDWESVKSAFSSALVGEDIGAGDTQRPDGGADAAAPRIP